MFKRLKAIFYAFLADAYFRSGKFDRGMTALSKVIEAQPNNPAAYNDRGFAFQAMGNHPRSIDDFDKALEIEPRLAIAHFNRGISWKLLGDFDRAIADQSRAVALIPRFAEAHGELGVVYQCRHDFDRSIESLTTAIALTPEHRSHLKHRGLALFYRGDFTTAAADLQQVADFENDASAMLLLYLARMKAGEAAIWVLEKHAARLTKRQWPAAMVELYLGRLTPDAALAGAATPEQRAEAQFYLGEWHLMRNKPADAKQALQMAAQSCPAWFIEHIGATVALKRLE
jgi:lipoprotein NlpI